MSSGPRPKYLLATNKEVEAEEQALISGSSEAAVVGVDPVLCDPLLRLTDYFFGKIFGRSI